ncbi:MAG: hypothetical protein Q4E99_03835 [Bacillota bacterium]|nr:hypothetical protein [Bacillota bacterium]
MKIRETISEHTIVSVQEWTMYGLMQGIEMPLSDVLTYFNNTNSSSLYVVILVNDDCRLFSYQDKSITLDEHEYQTQDDVSIKSILFKKGDYGVVISDELFSPEQYMEDCDIPEEKRPEILKKMDAISKAKARK